MYRRSRLLVVLLALAVAVPVFSQDEPAPRAQPTRKLDLTTLTSIPPDPNPAETFSGPRQLPDFTGIDFNPNFQPKLDTLFERTKHTVFVRRIWNLEFTFKPLRMVEVDVPEGDSGTLKYQKKVIWYMVYRVTNRDNVIGPVTDADPDRAEVLAQSDAVSLTNRFIPHFVMEAWVGDPTTQQYDVRKTNSEGKVEIVKRDFKVYNKREYLDKILPAALRKIRDRELILPAKPMLKDSKGNPVLDHRGRPVIIMNSAQMSQVPIPTTTDADDNSVWGVVTWQDVNPNVDFASIYVQGLTNAFRFHIDQGGKKSFEHKTLQLNFWRPGDRLDETDDAIRFGVPLVGSPPEQVKLFNMYQLPGPMIAGYEVSKDTNHETFLFRVNAAEVDFGLVSPPPKNTVLFAVDGALQMMRVVGPATLEDTLIADPLAMLRPHFAKAGVPLPPDAKPTIEVKKQWWEFEANVAGRTRFFRLRYEPQHWDIGPAGIKVIQEIDHLWIYRDQDSTREPRELARLFRLRNLCLDGSIPRYRKWYNWWVVRFLALVAYVMPTVLETNLVRTPDICGGRLRIDGTRMTVNQIVALHNQGLRAEQIVEQYPQRNLGEIFTVLAWYHANKHEFDKELAAEIDAAEAAQQQLGKAQPS